MVCKPIVSVVIPTHNRKEKLVRLINSIYNNNYPSDRLEIIVVDDCSVDGTAEEVKSRYPLTKIVRNEIELFLAGSRNAGIKVAKGEYVFLVDDDNILDKNCISELVSVFENNVSSLIGIAAPIMYYFEQPNKVWCAGIKRNMITSRTKFIGKDEIDYGQFNILLKSNDFPNAFMVGKEIIKKVGMFDESNFPIHYDEADFGARVRRSGYNVICNPKAKIWHDIPLPKEDEIKARSYHVHSRLRAYYAGRNRIVFHRKYSKWWQFLIFILVANWLFGLYYLKIILFGNGTLKKENIALAKSYLKGISDGILQIQ